VTEPLCVLARHKRSYSYRTYFTMSSNSNHEFKKSELIAEFDISTIY
jgi:YHS domain-containing protein